MRLFVVLLIAACAGCGNDLECIEFEPTCARLYEPTFDNVHAMTLLDKCVDGPCHNPVSRRAGMSFEDPDDAYMHLVEEGRAVAGDPQCSLVMQRIGATNSSLVMPPGNRLSDTERCSIGQWIANGAQR